MPSGRRSLSNMPIARLIQFGVNIKRDVLAEHCRSLAAFARGSRWWAFQGVGRCHDTPPNRERDALGRDADASIALRFPASESAICHVCDISHPERAVLARCLVVVAF
jgi:hypothetical protein